MKKSLFGMFFLLFTTFTLHADLISPTESLRFEIQALHQHLSFVETKCDCGSSQTWKPERALDLESRIIKINDLVQSGKFAEPDDRDLMEHILVIAIRTYLTEMKRVSKVDEGMAFLEAHNLTERLKAIERDQAKSGSP